MDMGCSSQVEVVGVADGVVLVSVSDDSVEVLVSEAVEEEVEEVEVSEVEDSEVVEVEDVLEVVLDVDESIDEVAAGKVVAIGREEEAGEGEFDDDNGKEEDALSVNEVVPDVIVEEEEEEEEVDDVEDLEVVDDLDEVELDVVGDVDVEPDRFTTTI